MIVNRLTEKLIFYEKFWERPSSAIANRSPNQTLLLVSDGNRQLKGIGSGIQRCALPVAFTPCCANTGIANSESAYDLQY